MRGSFVRLVVVTFREKGSDFGTWCESVFIKIAHPSPVHTRSPSTKLNHDANPPPPIARPFAIGVGRILFFFNDDEILSSIEHYEHRGTTIVVFCPGRPAIFLLVVDIVFSICIGGSAFGFGQ